MEIEDACEPYASRPHRRWFKGHSRPEEWTARPEPPIKWLKGLRQAPRQPRSNDLQPTFDRLKDEWERATANISDANQIVLHDAYQRIIGLGPSILPLILRDFQSKLSFWFPALKALTGEDPVSEEDRGDLEAMRSAWLHWATRNGHIRS